MRLNLIKHNFLKRNSIPILLKRSIPITCAVALLLNMLIFVNGDVYAAPECHETGGVKEDYNHQYDDGNTSICTYTPALTAPTDHAIPSISLSIDNGSTTIYDKVLAEYNKANYSEHIVKVSAKDITDYAITLSNAKITGPGSLTGANNAAGSALPNNSWGYGWGAADVVNDDITYNSAISKSFTGDSVSNNQAEFSRKLVFATKFDENAIDGTYKVSATLSVTATPATLTYVAWNDMKYMQDMTPEACSSVDIGANATLEDLRDDNMYVVTKLSDGKCWMTENLRLQRTDVSGFVTGGNGAMKFVTLSNLDSDVSISFTMPKNQANGFTGTDNNAAYYGGNEVYGGYYSWYTATAGTGTAAMTSGEASSSICPKGWKLPTQAEYTTLKHKGAAKRGIWDSDSVTSGYWIGASTDNATGGAFWPAAGGYINDSVPDGVDTYGYYWSSTANDSSYAYRLIFYNTSMPYLSGYNKYAGFSVRCVAR